MFNIAELYNIYKDPLPKLPEIEEVKTEIKPEIIEEVFPRKIDLEELKDFKSMILQPDEIYETTPEEAEVYSEEYEKIINNIGADDEILNSPLLPTQKEDVIKTIKDLGLKSSKIIEFIKPGIPLHNIFKLLLVFLGIGSGLSFAVVIAIIGILAEKIFMDYDKNKSNA